MFKKFISMATAVLLMASGISVIAPASASANNSQANITIVNRFSPYANLAGFDTSVLDHTFNVSSNKVLIFPSAVSPATIIELACNGTVLPNGNADCDLNLGANTYTIKARSQDQSLIRTYTLTYNFTPPAAPVLTTTSNISAGQANPTIVIESSIDFICTVVSCYTFDLGTTGLTVGTMSRSGRTLTIPFTGTASAGTLTFRMPIQGSRPASNVLSFVVGGGSSPAPSTPAEIAAAAAAVAAAAAQAAAVARAAEIATAQTALATVLRGDKAGTLSEYRSANINITTTAALTRLNAEVLKLPAADRTDFAKIKAIADKIEFDESFFNATSRPSLATYSSYGVTGVTERILPVINAKVLELPAALRADVKAMQELVKVESFVDRVANPATRSTVSSSELVSRGLLAAEYPRRHSIVNGLARYPEGSLNTMAKIEAAIKEQIFIAEAPKRRLAEIKARMAARKK